MILVNIDNSQVTKKVVWINCHPLAWAATIPCTKHQNWRLSRLNSSEHTHDHVLPRLMYMYVLIPRPHLWRQFSIAEAAGLSMWACADSRTCICCCWVPIPHARCRVQVWTSIFDNVIWFDHRKYKIVFMCTCDYFVFIYIAAPWIQTTLA